MNTPKISIITPSFNQGKYIEECIQSVLNQNYDYFEHIVVDGGSTDNTVMILKKYPHLKWISEPDNGQSDALNKALKISTGDIIGWMNTDDYYCENIFQTVVSYFVNKKIQWIVGQNYIKYELIQKTIPANSNITTYQSLMRGDDDVMRTQAAFFKKDLLEKIGGFDATLHFVMDYDAWIKMSKIGEPLNANEFFCICRIHPGQKTTIKNYRKKIPELIQVCIKHKTYLGLARSIFKMIKTIVKKKLKVFLITLNIINEKYSEVPFSTRK
jgi:glycosyltransferase involved in cell wall biosynthesis